MQNILTIDLEDWYQTQSYRSKISIHDWDKIKGRLVTNTSEILEILRKFNTKATFFVLGYNAKRHPDIIHLIKREGHELGLHGYYHNLVYRQSFSQFNNETDYSKKLIEDISQAKVIGFRAPNWSITTSCLWALDILIQLGFCYDSSMDESVFRKSYKKIPQGLLEIHRPALKFLNKSIPFSGGFFLRAYPYFFIRHLIRQKNKKGQKVVIYIHPWEIDKDAFCIKPHLPKRIISNFRLASTKEKLHSLLRDFEFNSIKNIFFGKNHYE